MNRVVGWALLSLGLASVVTAVTVAPSGATPPSGLTNIPLARGTNTSHGTIPLQFGTDVAMAQITVDPGGSSGWHSHPGGAIVVVKQGSLTVYRSVGSQCQTETYSAGRRSSSDLAKWIKSSTRARSHTSFSSPSRVCLRATPRELTSRTRAHARVSDDLTRARSASGPGTATAGPSRGR
jgi:quercetin dioxygenase-like cupin family protein